MRLLFDDLYLHTILLHCAHEQKAQGVRLIGVANKNAILRHSWALPNDSKHNRASFFDDLQFGCAYESLRSLDLKIWKFLC